MSETRRDCVDPPTIPAYLDAHMAAHRVVCAFSMIQTRWQIDAIAEAFQRVAVAAEQARADWAGGRTGPGVSRRVAPHTPVRRRILTTPDGRASNVRATEGHP